MGHGDHLRPALLALLLLAPSAAAGEVSFTETRAGECGSDALRADAERARVDAEGRRGCGETPGDYVNLVVAHPQGRLYVVWERQEGNESYSEFAIAQPPRVVEWHADEHGCWMTVAVAGARDHDCPKGRAPPPPPRVPWGRLLP